MFFRFRNSFSTGFTLFEFLVTFGILALLITVAAASLRAAGPSLAMRASARMLASDLRYTSELSSSTQIAHALRINPISSSYTIVRLSDPEIVVKEVRLNEAIRMSEITIPSGSVIFNTLGATSTPGTIRLTHSNGATNIIDVRPSGYVRIE